MEVTVLVPEYAALLEALQCMREPSPPEEEVWSYFEMLKGAL
jgi:hypothetical protein